MANYPTSQRFKAWTRKKRVIVYYESSDKIRGFTMAVEAYSLSEATALCIAFIDKHNLSKQDEEYYLYPDVSNEKSDFTL